MWRALCDIGHPYPCSGAVTCGENRLRMPSSRGGSPDRTDRKGWRTVNSIAAAHAPDVKIPLAHILTGAVAALFGGLLLLWQGPALLRHPLGDFRTLALTHLFTLGWLAMTITGATYQLVPVVLEVRLHSERLARAGYPVLAIGVALMVAGFWAARLTLLIPGALLAAVALLVYAGHMAVTALPSPAHRMHRLFFLGATAYLTLVCILGGLMVAEFRWGFLHVDLLPAHVIAAILGWATLLAMGAAYKLTPMFALSHGHGEGAGTAVFALGASGTLLLLVGAVLGWPASATALIGLPLLGAVVLFLRDQWLFFRSRYKPRLDVGLRLVVVACGYLGLTALLGWADLAGLLRLPPAALVILAVLGWCGCLVGGQTYKIVPFLVWFHRYASQAGREKVPLLREMYDERVAGVGMWGLAAAGLLLSAGTGAGIPWLLRLGALAWLGGYGALAYNLLQVLRA